MEDETYEVYPFLGGLYCEVVDVPGQFYYVVAVFALAVEIGPGLFCVTTSEHYWQDLLDV